MTYTIMCDQCGHTFRYKHMGEKEEEGWTEVWVAEEEQLDFCTRECVVAYMSGRESE